MDIEMVRDWAIKLSDVEESFPFGEGTLVFKVGGKIFLLLALDETPGRLNVKCDPEKAILLREEFPEAVFPGYHMNKKHWNTVTCDGTASQKLIKEWISHSYDSVVSSLPQKLKKELEGL